MLLALTLPIVGIGQETFSSKVWAIDFQEPKSWLPMDKAQRSENIEKMELSKQAEDLINKSDAGFVLIAGYQKYDPTKQEGLIPGIQVQARKKGPTSFEVFKQQIIKSRVAFEKAFADFKVIEDSEISISGHPAMKTIVTFSISTPGGETMKARSTIIVLPRPTYFFQINLNDSSDGSVDCTSEFNSFIKSISISR